VLNTGGDVRHRPAVHMDIHGYIHACVMIIGLGHTVDISMDM